MSAGGIRIEMTYAAEDVEMAFTRFSEAIQKAMPSFAQMTSRLVTLSNAFARRWRGMPYTAPSMWHGSQMIADREGRA